MNDVYVLYNPGAGKKKGDIREKLKGHLADAEPYFIDMTTLDGYAELFGGTDGSDKVIVCGGDGTLNRFANDIDGLSVPCDILYYAAGSGNDFLKDLDRDGDTAPFSIKEYLTDLPRITVNGRTHRFINGVGLGLDGYCCAEVARAKVKGKKTSYVAVAIRAFLKDFSPVNAKITVDGTEYEYNNVWLVPTMKGRFFGGGVMAAPMQDRRGSEVTVLWMHNARRLTALLRFPSFLKGKHPKYKKMISVHKGRSITVNFDRPTDLQIDGEPFENVSEYTVEC
ncbi:MAG: diacylglycerol kinase family protein [Ruminococcaceae bacterium]|nr:diacylglycerol kinase family protein [Oscillospiraceae bacterium]